jgi:16S rRNA (guanine527-N7)-methyltransferase
MREHLDTIKDYAAAWGIVLELDQLMQLNGYHADLLEKNQSLNLTRIVSDEHAAWYHWLDSLAFGLFLADYALPNTFLMDLGTGGGFPGVPIAIAWPELDVYPVDSRGNKALAVEEIADLENVHVLCGRAGELVSTEVVEPGTFGVITARAVGVLEKLVKESRELLAPGGYLVCWKGPEAEKERKKADDRANRQGWECLPDIEYRLEGPDPRELRLVIYRKPE